VAPGAIWQLLSRYARQGVTLGNRLRLVIVTRKAGIVCKNVHVAGLAGDLSLPAVIQRKCVHPQLGRAPGCRRVAILALHSKKAGVNFRLRMAGEAFRWRPVENFLHVAGFAFDLGMAAFQREKVGMFEVAHPVNAIVTGQAFIAKLPDMFFDKLRFLSSVAIFANADLERIERIAVAGLASQCFAAVTGPVAIQTERRLDGVGEWFSLIKGWSPGLRAVAGLAVRFECILV
jgi:hypothetical protein